MPDDRPLYEAMLRIIAARMKAKKMTATALSQVTAIKQTTLSYNLRGKGTLGPDELERIAKALGTNYPGLVAEAMEARRPSR